MAREEAIEILEKEKAYMIEHGGDRQAEALTSAIKALEQEPKTGHWIEVPYNSRQGEYRPRTYVCSECGWEIDLCRGLQQDTGHRLFCEHCGAKMKNKEGEDK